MNKKKEHVESSSNKVLEKDPTTGKSQILFI